jgi:hypothetical protein
MNIEKITVENRPWYPNPRTAEFVTTTTYRGEAFSTSELVPENDTVTRLEQLLENAKRKIVQHYK